MDIPITYVLAGALALGYGVLLIIALRSRRRYDGFLPLTMVVAALAQAMYLLHPLAHVGPYAGLFVGGLTQPAAAVLLASLLLVVFSGLSLSYLGKHPLIAVLPGAVWWAVVAVLSLQIPDKTIILGQPGWLPRAFMPAEYPLATMTLAGIVSLGGFNLVLAVMSLAAADLSEIANRALYWLLMLPVVFMGALLGMSGSAGLKEIGWLLQFLGMIAALYGAVTFRVIDVRRFFKLSFTSAALVLITAFVIFVTAIIGQSPALNAQSAWLLLVGLSFVAALVYLFARSVMLAVLARLFGARPEDSTTAVRQYSQEIAGVVELAELANLAVDTMRKTLRVKRGVLLLATRDDNDTLRLEPMVSNRNETPEIRGWIPKDSPIYRALAEQYMPLLQYDIEYAPEYKDVPPELKSFFKQLKMSAYAPIFIKGQVIGVLAAGAKANDDPFSTQDLELLATLATQNGVALRNARLVSDLRKARDETEALNKDISRTKERLEQLDSVKTDFITIASHELRTPLAQIRGYTDILEAVTEQNQLDADQIAGITNNLRKATDRLERLIADMLDVSQLGLDAMDLRFAPTTIENVVRLAIEPLADSIKQRKLQLTAKKLKDLPPIEADMQRLVQAFRNIVLNAIKYTPDGGRIDITAHGQQNEQTKQDEIVVTIQDTGIGIEPRFHELIFEKFFRIADPGLHSTGATKFMGAGPGLGLTIARGVIQGHGGRIWVESEGQDAEKLPGTTVHVLLPVNPPSNARRVSPLPQISGTVKSITPGETSAKATATLLPVHRN